MQLLPGQQNQLQFLGIVIVVGLLLFAPGYSQTNNDNKIGVEATTVKKALNEESSPLHSTDTTLPGQKRERLETVAEKSATAALLSDKKTNSEQNNDVAAPPQKPTKKAGTINSQTATDNITITVSQKLAATSASSSYLNHHEESILNSDEEISDSLKAGFYFFVALSLSAISFIVFKVYRLRLSRAERKYGVQGDRSTQELTPLPIAIEDGASDDEDQTLFEVQRQTIRIL